MALTAVCLIAVSSGCRAVHHFRFAEVESGNIQISKDGVSLVLPETGLRVTIAKGKVGAWIPDSMPYTMETLELMLENLGTAPLPLDESAFAMDYQLRAATESTPAKWCTHESLLLPPDTRERSFVLLPGKPRRVTFTGTPPMPVRLRIRYALGSKKTEGAVLLLPTRISFFERTL
jgi:hypothetical protein